MTAIDQVSARLRDRYVIDREIGRGGMGTVYLARDIRLDRPVALKVLPAEFAAMPALRDRFLRETKTAASFSHPNIVPVYAVEEADDLLAFAMAYVEGESLADRVKRAGPLSVRDTVRLLQDVGYALAYAHGRGVVHRDIKPDNVMIERATGRALVMDFGIARVLSAPTAATRDGLTRVGEVVGTPEYMSPEQATGDQVDGRSDLYSLGLTAHFAVTGRPAITGDTTGKVLARQITESLPPIALQRPDLPSALAEAIDRCVVKDPDGRFQSAESLVEVLDAAQLAAPDIPVPIRLLTQDLGTLSMIIIFGVLIMYLAARALIAADAADEDFLLPLVALFTVLVTRVRVSMREVGLLAAGGFSADAIHRGLESVMAERESRRVELRGDQSLRAARRRTVIMASVQIVVAVAMFRIALSFRHPRPQGGYHVGLPGTVLVFTAIIMFSASLALLSRSPLRMPIGERLFRLVWLGPIGRAFVRVSGRRAWNAAAAGKGNVTGPAAIPARTVLPGKAVDPKTRSLEARVAALEQWRRESTR